MASTSAGFGLRPIGLVGGQPYAGSTRAIPITSGFGTNIYNGSVVKIGTNGTLEVVTNLGDNSDVFPAGTIGVFVGCQYENSDGELVNRQYWPASTVATNAVGFVIDDPRVIFKAQCSGAVTQTDLGQNTHLAAVQSTSTGSTATGNSNTQLDHVTNTTATWAFRIVGFTDDAFNSVGDDYTEVQVIFNPGSHSYTNQTGIQGE